MFPMYHILNRSYTQTTNVLSTSSAQHSVHRYEVEPVPATTLTDVVCGPLNVIRQQAQFLCHQVLCQKDMLVYVCRTGSIDRQHKIHVPWQSTGLQPIMRATPLAEVQHGGFSKKVSRGSEGLEEPVCPPSCTLFFILKLHRMMQLPEWAE